MVRDSGHCWALATHCSPDVSRALMVNVALRGAQGGVLAQGGSLSALFLSAQACITFVPAELC